MAGDDAYAVASGLKAPKGALPDALHPRHLAVRVVEIAALIALVVLAIDALPGLDEVRARLQNADATWIIALIAARSPPASATCSSFAPRSARKCPGDLSYDIAMAELAANSLLPAGGAGGLALGVWALRQAGMPAGHIARRTVAFFIVTSAANFFALILVGLGVFVGILPGTGSWLLTLVPALITALGVVPRRDQPTTSARASATEPEVERDGWRGHVVAS